MLLTSSARSELTGVFAIDALMALHHAARWSIARVNEFQQRQRCLEYQHVPDESGVDIQQWRHDQFLHANCICSSFPDRMRLLLSTNGASTTPADFSTVLVSVNEGLTTAGYPNAWTQFNVTISGLSGATSGRFAFNYNVPNGGPSGANSDFIGIDTVLYSSRHARRRLRPQLRPILQRIRQQRQRRRPQPLRILRRIHRPIHLRIRQRLLRRRRLVAAAALFLN